ncbi:MAG: outer membrane protein assembly factor BamB family protein [Ktedonobacterales bacterium]
MSSFLVGMIVLLAACSQQWSGTGTRPTGSPTAMPARTATTGAADGSQDWVRFGFDASRSGVNASERALTPGNVGQLHRLWQVQLPGVADSSPILLHGLALPDGSTRDVLYVTTRDGRLLAVDAASGATLWSHQTSGPKITHSSPVADPSRQYVYAYGLDGSLHKYRATDGLETSGGGWPVRITLMRETEKESSALNIANGSIYVTTSGYIGDAPPYQGHVVAVRLGDASTHVWNSLCSDLPRLLTAGDCQAQQSGIWARGGAVIDPVTGNIFVTTGNGPYDADRGGHNWGDSIVELSGDGSRVLDSYTPATHQRLNDADQDLGSVAPGPLQAGTGSKTPHLLVQGGKDGILRLLNRDNLSGAGGPGHIGGELQSITLGCGVFAQPAVWSENSAGGGTDWVFVATTCGLRAFQVVTDGSGTTRLRQAWTADITATSPVVAGGVLFALSNQGAIALDPHTGHRLWSSQQASAGGGIGGIHWESPIVIGGRLYCSDESGQLSVYGL